MVTTRKQTWSGASGASYTYDIYPINGSFPSSPGNYIFAKGTATSWVPLYIGQTSNLSSRLSPLSGHEKYDCARRHGITHVHIHVNTGGEQARLREERDLINRFNPPCNG